MASYWRTPLPSRNNVNGVCRSRFQQQGTRMAKIHVTLFVCTGKDCSKAWRHVCDTSPGKWLKRHVEEAGLPYKLNVVKTECMDRCEEAATVCLVHGTD